MKPVSNLTLQAVAPYKFYTGEQLVAYGNSDDQSSVRTSPIESITLINGQMVIETCDNIYTVTGSAPVPGAVIGE